MRYGDQISWTSERDQGHDAIIKGFARASKDRTIKRAQGA
jgi:plastocyanin